MRARTAVPIIVAGLLLMLLGIGQRTVWAPAETVTASVPQDAQDAEDVPLTVVGAGARGSGDGPVEVTVTAEGPFTLAVGRASDVEAWVGDAAHLSVTGISEDTLSGEHVAGEEAVPDPRGSDLWIHEESGEGTLTYRWSEPVEGDWSILLAAGGQSPAPTDVTVTRPNDRSTPFALPLLIGGALAVVLGIALLLTVQRPRWTGGLRGDGREPAEGTRAHARRRSKTGSKGTRSSIAAPLVVVVTTGLVGTGALLGVAPGRATTSPAPASGVASGSAFSLAFGPASGLTTSAAPTAGPTVVRGGAPSAGSDASGPPVVLGSQLERILASVASTVADADSAADATRLTPRVSGAALDLRTASYAVRAKDATATPPAPVAAAPLMLELVPTGPQWPRTIVALTKGADNPVPQALLLVQETPRENYRLTSAVQMLPGSTFPSAPAPGAARPVPLDEAGALTTAPQAAVQSIADYLTDPSGADAGTFEENSFAEAITQFQAGVIADPGNSAATITFSHVAEEDSTHALQTGDGGAMVFGYLTHTYTSVPKGKGDTIDLKDTIYQALTGRDVSDSGIDVNYGEAVMMYVPPAGSEDRIRVIGAAQQLVSATLR